MLSALFEDARRVTYHRQQLHKLLKGYRTMQHETLVRHALQNLSAATALLEKNIMAAKGKETPKVDFKGFANVELTVEEKQAMRDWIREEEEVALAIENMVASGHKLTVTYNDATKAYQATAFCTYHKSPNAGYIMSAFAPHWYDALACLCWKHYILCKGGIWKPDKPQDTQDMFG